MDMEKMIACCGLICTDCSAYLATQADDDGQRKKVAREWSIQYKAEIKPEDINCDGCMSGGDRIFGHCEVCEIRKCVQEKGFANCAHCSDYACEKLDFIFNAVPATKSTLDNIKKGL